MKLIFIAGPLRDPMPYRVLENIWHARTWSLRIAECGAMPICPHTNSGSLYGAPTVSEVHWCAGNLELLRRCDAAFFLPNWLRSDGAQAEHIFAEQHRILCFGSGDYPHAITEWARQ